MTLQGCWVAPTWTKWTTTFARVKVMFFTQLEELEENNLCYMLNSNFLCDKPNKPVPDLPPLLQLALLLRKFGLKARGGIPKAKYAVSWRPIFLSLQWKAAVVEGNRVIMFDLYICQGNDWKCCEGAKGKLQPRSEAITK